MRIAVCDSDSFMREMVESIAATVGHEVVGVATDTQSAVGLLQAAHPDIAVIDIAMHVGSDFDLVTIAEEVDALDDYPTRPEVIFKPDFSRLEAALRQTGHGGSGDQERRQRPVRAAQGPAPASVTDAQAFFEALNNAQDGDALVAFDVPAGAETVAEDVWRTLRDTDRVLLILPRGVRCFLPGGGEEGIQSVLSRVAGLPSITEGGNATSVVVGDGEHGADAFDRLKREGEPRPLS